MIKKKGWTPGKGRMGCPDRGGRRSGMFMGSPGKKDQDLGVGILAALSIAGLQSSVCPSYFTMVTFGSQPEAKARAMEGLWISLGLCTAASIAIYSVWRNLEAGLFAEGTALALFGIGVVAINREPPKTVPPIEKQNTGPTVAVPQQAATQPA
jgi:hypothetical protein